MKGLHFLEPQGAERIRLVGVFQGRNRIGQLQAGEPEGVWPQALGLQLLEVVQGKLPDRGPAGNGQEAFMPLAHQLGPQRLGLPPGVRVLDHTGRLSRGLLDPTDLHHPLVQPPVEVNAPSSSASGHVGTP